LQIKIKIICTNSIVIQKIKETGAAPSLAVELAASVPSTSFSVYISTPKNCFIIIIYEKYQK